LTTWVDLGLVANCKKATPISLGYTFLSLNKVKSKQIKQNGYIYYGYERIMFNCAH